MSDPVVACAPVAGGGTGGAVGGKVPIEELSREQLVERVRTLKLKKHAYRALNKSLEQQVAQLRGQLNEHFTSYSSVKDALEKRQRDLAQRLGSQVIVAETAKRELVRSEARVAELEGSKRALEEALGTAQRDGDKLRSELAKSNAVMSAKVMAAKQAQLQALHDRADAAEQRARAAQRDAERAKRDAERAQEDAAHWKQRCARVESELREQRATAAAAAAAAAAVAVVKRAEEEAAKKSAPPQPPQPPAKRTSTPPRMAQLRDTAVPLGRKRPRPTDTARSSSSSSSSSGGGGGARPAKRMVVTPRAVEHVPVVRRGAEEGEAAFVERRLRAVVERRADMARVALEFEDAYNVVCRAKFVRGVAALVCDTRIPLAQLDRVAQCVALVGKDAAELGDAVRVFAGDECAAGRRAAAWLRVLAVYHRQRCRDNAAGRAAALHALRVWCVRHYDHARAVDNACQAWPALVEEEGEGDGDTPLALQAFQLVRQHDDATRDALVATVLERVRTTAPADSVHLTADESDAVAALRVLAVVSGQGAAGLWEKLWTLASEQRTRVGVVALHALVGAAPLVGDHAGKRRAVLRLFCEGAGDVAWQVACASVLVALSARVERVVAPIAAWCRALSDDTRAALPAVLRAAVNE